MRSCRGSSCSALSSFTRELNGCENIHADVSIAPDPSQQKGIGNARRVKPSLTQIAGWAVTVRSTFCKARSCWPAPKEAFKRSCH